MWKHRYRIVIIPTRHRGAVCLHIHHSKPYFISLAIIIYYKKENLLKSIVSFHKTIDSTRLKITINSPCRLAEKFVSRRTTSVLLYNNVRTARLRLQPASKCIPRRSAVGMRPIIHRRWYYIIYVFRGDHAVSFMGKRKWVSTKKKNYTYKKNMWKHRYRIVIIPTRPRSVYILCVAL